MGSFEIRLLVTGKLPRRNLAKDYIRSFGVRQHTISDEFRALGHEREFSWVAVVEIGRPYTCKS